jgi:hypothetical protein
MRRSRIGATVAAVAVVLATGVGAAQAAPKNGEHYLLNCDNGQSYSVVVPPGNGPWTPGIRVDGRGVFKPTAIGDFAFTAVGVAPTEGTFGGSFEGFDVQGNKPKGGTMCTFSVSERVTVGADNEFELPAGTYDITFSATVIGFARPG